MSTYTFVSEDDQGSASGIDRQEVNFTFDTDSLQDVTEKFFWFIRAAGFNYVNEVSVGNCKFSA